MVDPPGMVALDGTGAAEGLSLERETTAPPLGAGPFRVTVPVEGFPPVTVAARAGDEGRRAGTVIKAVGGDSPPPHGEMTTVVDVAAALVLTVNDAVVTPGGRARLPLPGTEAAAGLLLERDTTAPPPGA